MVSVTKVNGAVQPFDREKVIRTCLRFQCSREDAENVANRIQSELYEGIATREILRMIYRYSAEGRPQLKYEVDLRKAISLLRSKPDFEQYIVRLLSEHGYNVTRPQIVRGRCVEHEIDAAAGKNGETFYVEAKHHIWPHTFTGKDIFLQARATLEDLVNGYESGFNTIHFNKAMVICNTKLSDHAMRYADCAQIEYICWKSPKDNSLEKLVENKQLYPVTVLKALDSRTEARFGDAGIVLLRELLDLSVEELSVRTKVSKDKIRKLVKRAQEITK